MKTSRHPENGIDRLRQPAQSDCCFILKKEICVKNPSTLILLLVVIAATGVLAGGGADKFDPGRDAAKDIQNATAEAKQTGKRVLLDVGGEWCIWCHRLDTLFATHPDLNEFMHKNFVVVKVNYSKENKNEKVLSRYPKIPGYPHLFVLDSSGKLLCSQDTGELESGKGHDPDKVMSFLKKWVPPTTKR
ncbi:MAG TPA: thiol-disulfide isomerase [Bacteroidetes bacterium]|nr:thiol-disulfide isomerase [Bacteroidota bacterium]